MNVCREIEKDKELETKSRENKDRKNSKHDEQRNVSFLFFYTIVTEPSRDSNKRRRYEKKKKNNKIHKISLRFYTHIFFF